MGGKYLVLESAPPPLPPPSMLGMSAQLLGPAPTLKVGARGENDFAYHLRSHYCVYLSFQMDFGSEILYGFLTDLTNGFLIDFNYVQIDF